MTRPNRTTPISAPLWAARPRCPGEVDPPAARTVSSNDRQPVLTETGAVARFGQRTRKRAVAEASGSPGLRPTFAK